MVSVEAKVPRFVPPRVNLTGRAIDEVVEKVRSWDGNTVTESASSVVTEWLEGEVVEAYFVSGNAVESTKDRLGVPYGSNAIEALFLTKSAFLTVVFSSDGLIYRDAFPRESVSVAEWRSFEDSTSEKPRYRVQAEIIYDPFNGESKFIEYGEDAERLAEFVRALRRLAG